MKKQLIIIGGGGHAHVVAESISDEYEVIGFLDDNEDAKNIGEIKRIGKIAEAEKFSKDTIFHIAIGNNSIRKNIGENLKLATIIHPTAVISKSSKVEEGCYIGINTVINSNAKIGRGCIINTGTIVEHETVIGDYSHLSYRVLVGAGSEIGNEIFIDMNTVIERGKIIV